MMLLSRARNVVSELLQPDGYAKVADAGYRLFTAALTNAVEFKSRRSVLTLQRKQSFQYWLHLLIHLLGNFTVLVHVAAYCWRTYAEWNSISVWQQSMLFFFLYLNGYSTVTLWICDWRQEEVRASILAAFHIEATVRQAGCVNQDNGIYWWYIVKLS